MRSAPAFYWPPTFGPSRSQVIAVWASMPVTLSWPSKAAYGLDGASYFQIWGAEGPQNGIGFVGGGVAADGSLWGASVDGECVQLTGSPGAPASGATVSLPACLSSGCVSGSTLYAGSVTGSVYSVTPLGYTVFADLNSLPRGLQAYGDTLWAVLPRTGQMVSVSASGTPSYYGTPMDVPFACAPGASGVAVIGRTEATLSPSLVKMVMDGDEGAAISPSMLYYLTGTDPDIGITATASVAGALDVALIPGSYEIAVLTSGAVLIFSLVAGALVQTQSVAVSGGAALTYSVTRGQIIVTQPGADMITVLRSDVGEWSLDSTFPVPDPSLLWCGTTTASSSAGPTLLVASGNSVLVMETSDNIWATVASIPLGAPPSAVYSDGALAYATYTQGGTGYLKAASLTSGAMESSASWSGSAGACVSVAPGVIAVLDPANSDVRTYLVGPLSLAFISSTAVRGNNGFSWTGQSLWVFGAVSYRYERSGNGSFALMSESVAAFYAEGSWGSYTFPEGEDATAVALDSSGSIVVATSRNNLYRFPADPSGFAPSSEALSLVSGQKAGTPLCVSALMAIGGNIYGATSFGGAILEIPETGFS